MAISVTHTKVANIPDFTQEELDKRIALKQYPEGTTLNDIALNSDWNDEHTITGVQETLPNFTTGQILFGDGDNVPSTSPLLTYSSNTLSVASPNADLLALTRSGLNRWAFRISHGGLGVDTNSLIIKPSSISGGVASDFVVKTTTLDGGTPNFVIKASGITAVGGVPYQELFEVIGGRIAIHNGGGAGRKVLTMNCAGFGGLAYARFQSYDYGVAIGLPLVINDIGGNVSIGTSNDIAKLGIVGAGATSATYSLRIHNSTGSSNSLIVRDDGFVGVGSVPTAMLEAKKSSNSNNYAGGIPAISVWNSNTVGDSFAAYRMAAKDGAVLGEFFADGNNAFGIGSNSIYFRASTNHPLVFGTNSVPRVFILGDGKVGIGTASPESGFHLKGAYPIGYAITERTGVNGAGDVSVGAYRADGKTVGDGIIFNFEMKNSADVYKSYGQLRIKTVSTTAGAESANLRFMSFTNGAITEKLTILSTGNVGVGQTSPTAAVHIKAGTATANTAPLKLTAGTNLTTPESGAFEFDGTFLYFTVGGVRKTVTLI